MDTKLTLPERDWRDILLLLADVHGIMRAVAEQHGDYHDISDRTRPALDQLATAADALSLGLAKSNLPDNWLETWEVGEPYGENAVPLAPVTVGFEPERAQHLLQRLDHVAQAQHISFTDVYGNETIGRLKALSVHAERLHGNLRGALLAAGLEPQDVPPGGRYIPDAPSQVLTFTQPERAWRDLYKVLTQIHGSAKAVGEYLPGLAEQMEDVNRTLDAAVDGFFDALDATHIGLRHIERVWQPQQPLGWWQVPDNPVTLPLPLAEAQQLRRLLAWGGRLALLPYLAQVGPHVMGLLHGYGRDAQQVFDTFSAALAATGAPLEDLPSNLATLAFHRPN